MIGKNSLTAEQQQWLIDNYHAMPKVQCAAELNIGVKVLRRIAKELGIWSAPAPKSIFEESKPIKSKYDNGKGYCMDCCHYGVGGVCKKTTRITGALHRKECFKSNND